VLKVEAVDSDKGINDNVVYKITSENWVSRGCGSGKDGVGLCLSHWKTPSTCLLFRFHKAWMV
jgi:hypothetical protein